MKRHAFVPMVTPNKCIACDMPAAAPIHSVTLAQQQADLRDAWIELGESLIAEGQIIIDWLKRERQKLR